MKQPIKELKCLKDNYIRACKLTQDEKTMVVCGETKEIIVWDLEKVLFLL